MKKFVLFLPQFHSIPENDEWWGKGFTEWKKVKNARKLFAGHNQPKVPLDNNYYNLLDKRTVEWHTELMHKYNIDAFVYYHYYFNGKKLLEKPAENLLNWKDIKQPFFFNWANHSWIRSWEGKREILIEQTYGDLNSWKKHFDYLLPFFKDERYVKMDNKPLFMIYNPNFKEKNDMIEFFNKKCIEAGFNGICIIEECFYGQKKSLEVFMSKSSAHTDYIYLTEPLVGRYLIDKRYGVVSVLFEKIRNFCVQKGIIKRVKKYNGDDIYKALLRKNYDSERIIPGIFFEWDNTPRHGYRGSIITPTSHEVFMKYIKHINSSPFVIINAWNEWAEGMILEPTISNGFKYLEWIKEIE